MDVDYLLNYPGEHEESLEILTDEEIIDSVTKNKKTKLRIIVLLWSLFQKKKSHQSNNDTK